eukprot:711525-Rhodomonas_salina.4
MALIRRSPRNYWDNDAPVNSPSFSGRSLAGGRELEQRFEEKQVSPVVPYRSLHSFLVAQPSSGKRSRCSKKVVGSSRRKQAMQVKGRLSNSKLRATSTTSRTIEFQIIVRESRRSWPARPAERRRADEAAAAVSKEGCKFAL